MAYISTSEVAEIRKALKSKFGKSIKFSVARRGSGLGVSVSIMAANIDFSDILPDINANEYGFGHTQLNQYHWDGTKHTALFNQILKIIHTAPANATGGTAWFDKSDIMTDYFHTAFYIDINIGKWNKPYVLNTNI